MWKDGFSTYLDEVHRFGLEQLEFMHKNFGAGLIIPSANLTEKLTVRVNCVGRRYVDLFQDDIVLIGIYTELEVSSTGG